MGKPTKKTKKYSAKHLSSEIAARKKAQAFKAKNQKKVARAQAQRDHPAQPEQDHSEEEQEEQVDGEGEDAEGPYSEAGFEKFLAGETDASEANGEAQADDDDDEMDSDESLEDFEEHMKELEALKEADPEFFAHLQKEESDLLSFGKDEVEEKRQQKETDAADPRQTLTVAQMTIWDRLVRKGASVRAMKKLMYAFRVAAHLNDAEVAEEEEAMSFQWKIVESGVFNHIVVYTFKNFATLFDILLERPAPAKGKKAAAAATAEATESPTDGWLPTKSPKWDRLRGIVKLFLREVLYFVGQLSEAKMQAFVLQHVQRLHRYTAVYQNIAKKFLRKMLEMWSSGAETVRVLAFLNIRQMALDIPFPFLDHCLKGLYLTYVKNAKFYTPKSKATIQFLANCVVELYSMDFVSAYQHAFVYIRQLAIHLRTALIAKDKNIAQNVYNWQTIHSIGVWVQWIGAHPGQEHVKMLIYPVVQLLEGLIALQPSARYLPLRLHVVALLNQMAEKTSVYVNSGAYLQEVLRLDLGNKLSATKVKNFDLATSLKDRKLASTKIYQDAVFYYAHELLFQYLAANASSIAFPELAVPLVAVMRKFVKSTRMAQYKRQIQQLLDKVAVNTKFIQAKRNSVPFGPKQSAQAKNFADQLRDETPLAKAWLAFQPLRPSKQQPKYDDSNRDESDDEGSESQSDEEAADNAEGSDEVVDFADEAEAEVDQNGDAESDDEEEEGAMDISGDGEDVVRRVKASEFLGDSDESDGDQMADDDD